MKACTYKDNDFYLDKFIYDGEALRQNIIARCSVIKGELPYNITLGIPLGGNKEELDFAILDLILNTEGVQSAYIVDSKIINRQYVCELSIQSIFGNMQINI